jgi:hypothetical protein
MISSISILGLDDRRRRARGRRRHADDAEEMRARIPRLASIYDDPDQSAFDTEMTRSE